MNHNMDQRDFVKAAGLTAISLGKREYAANSGILAGKEGGNKPNILLVLADDLGNRCLSCFPVTVPTPNLDRLVREGMIFNNAHAAPMCKPTRDEMFTGLSRANRGRPDLCIPFFTNHLKRLGYTNCITGKCFVGCVFDPLPDGAERPSDRKGDSREGGTRIPLVVSWPAKIKPASFCEDLVHVQDFLPTCVDLAGWALPSNRACDGRSFYPQLFAQKRTFREWLVGSGAHPSIWLKRVVNELGKPDMKAYKLIWVHRRQYKLYNDGRFYDLREDLSEQHHIQPDTGSSQAEATRRKYQAVLDQYIQSERLQYGENNASQ